MLGSAESEAGAENPVERFESDCPLVNFTDSQENPMGDNKKSVDTLGLRWVVVKRDKGFPQLRFRVHGRQVSVSTETRAPLSKAKQTALIRAWLAANPVKAKGAAGFTSEIERYIRLQYEGKATHTVYEVRLHLSAFRDALGVQSVQEITKRLCEARKDSMQAGRSPKTWKNMVTSVRRFLRWEISEGNLPQSPDPIANFKNPSRKLFGRRVAVWELERYTKTLAKLRGDDRDFLTIIHETGIDSADAYQLRPAHIVQARRADGSKFWKLYKLRAKAKSADEMIDQPLSKEAQRVILPRLEKWWDVSRFSGAMTFASGFLRRVQKAQRAAGFEPMDIKSLRHTFASRHAKRYTEGAGGPPMEELRRWMGHAPSSRILESVYIHTKSTGLYMD